MENSVKSMTGYGKGERSFGVKRVSVEIKTLNSKQLDMSLRMPSVYREREFEVRARLNKAIVRGKADVYINVESNEGRKSLPINKEVFADYYRQLSAIASENGIEHGDVCSTILRLPDVLASEKEEISEQEWDALFEALDAAIDALNSFRSQEGLVLMQDLTARIDNIERLKEAVVPFEKCRTEVVRNRIIENLKSIENVAIDNNRLEQEMIYYIEKFDITEEKVRLKNHLDYFKEVSRDASAGRKLGFICQEIGREINTMGSKANNADIQRIVVDMKDELEKIKEQILNIL